MSAASQTTGALRLALELARNVTADDHPCVTLLTRASGLVDELDAAVSALVAAADRRHTLNAKRQQKYRDSRNVTPSVEGVGGGVFSGSGSGTESDRDPAKSEAISPKQATTGRSEIPEVIAVRDPRYVTNTSDDVTRVWDAYRASSLAHSPRARPVLNGPRRRLISSRLSDGYDVATLVDAIRGMFECLHNLGQNDRETKYLGLEHALGTAERVERHSAAWRDGQDWRDAQERPSGVSPRKVVAPPDPAPANHEQLAFIGGMRGRMRARMVGT